MVLASRRFRIFTIERWKKGQGEGSFVFAAHRRHSSSRRSTEESRVLFVAWSIFDKMD